MKFGKGQGIGLALPTFKVKKGPLIRPMRRLPDQDLADCRCI